MAKSGPGEVRGGGTGVAVQQGPDALLCRGLGKSDDGNERRRADQPGDRLERRRNGAVGKDWRRVCMRNARTVRPDLQEGSYKRAEVMIR